MRVPGWCGRRDSSPVEAKSDFYELSALSCKLRAKNADTVTPIVALILGSCSESCFEGGEPFFEDADAIFEGAQLGFMRG